MNNVIQCVTTEDGRANACSCVSTVSNNGNVRKFDTYCRFPFSVEYDKIKLAACVCVCSSKANAHTNVRHPDARIHPERHYSNEFMCDKQRKNTSSDELNDVIASLVRINTQNTHARFRIEFTQIATMQTGKSDCMNKSSIDWVSQPASQCQSQHISRQQLSSRCETSKNKKKKIRWAVISSDNSFCIKMLFHFTWARECGIYALWN